MSLVRFGEGRQGDKRQGKGELREIRENISTTEQQAHIEQLIAQLNYDDMEQYWRARAELTAIGAKVVPQLIEMLWSTNLPQETVQEVGEVLADIGDARAIQPLLSVLQQEGSFRHPWGIGIHQIIKQFGERAVRPLIAIAKDKSQSTETRIKAIRNLEHIKDPIAFEPMLEILQDEQGSISNSQFATCFIAIIPLWE
jgi:hypothetical protein